MRAFLVGCMALALVGAEAQQASKAGVVPSDMKIDRPGTKPWTKSKLSVAQLAQKVADATLRIQNTAADMIILVHTPEGQGFFSTPNVELRIMGGKLYRVDYVVLHEIPFSCSTANDGKTRTVRLDQKIVKMDANRKLDATLLRGTALLRQFETDFSRMMFQGLTDGVDAWKPVLAGWAAGADGYKVSVEERTMKHQGHTFTNYRIHAQRVGPLVKTLGQSTFEIVLDGTRHLPVTVRHVRVKPKGETWAMMWSASYRFNQRFSIEDMVIGNRKN